MADVPGTEKAAPAATKEAARPARAAKKAAVVDDRVHVWPYLVRAEFIASIIVMVILTVWSITINAPLEEPANPTNTPNPSKAPWYFLGLQEMLVYFDPWLAGVVFPSLIIVGLMVIPFIDINPNGNGYYTFRERRFAIITFLFGFLVLWVSLIILGTFFRGPGWNLFLPWQRWDPHKVVALNNVDLPNWDLWGYPLPFKWMGNPKVKDLWLIGPLVAGSGLGIVRDVGEVELLGGGLITLYYGLGVAYYLWRRGTSETLQRLGPVRYGIVAFLFLSMMGLPIKALLRIGPPMIGLFPIKYVWVTPWFNI